MLQFCHNSQQQLELINVTMKNILVQPDQHTIQIYQNQLQIEAHASEIIMEKMKEINQKIKRSPIKKRKYSKRTSVPQNVVCNYRKNYFY